jgi:two-component system cell cycle sensor histidine kinase/response regulator CckA
MRKPSQASGVLTTAGETRQAEESDGAMSEPLRSIEAEPEEERAVDESRSLRLLVIVDDLDVSREIRTALAAEPGSTEVEWVHAVEDALPPLRRDAFDVVVLDLTLVGGHSLALLDEAALQEGEAWLVLLEEPRQPFAHPRRLLDRLAHETLPREDNLGDGLGRVLRLARRTLALRARASRYQSLFRSSNDGIVLFDDGGIVLDANPRACVQLGLAREELRGARFESLHADDEGPRLRSALRDVRGGGVATFELQVRRSDGTTFPAEVSASPFRHGSRQLVQAVVRDLSARRALEQRLLEVQKMEALGRLAGGVAHDLNNLLTVIQGYGALLRDSLAEAGQPHPFLAEVTDAGSRAAALTRQLLAFSRRQVLDPRLLDLNAEVSQLQRLLRRTLGEDVRLDVELATGLPQVRLDPGQLEQVIVNLAVNARDAMPRGGTLTLATGTAPRPQTAAGGLVASDESWVRLQVRDTGSGMPPEILRHAFEPFFTTKERGKGTGLGLASVYGIVRQSGGEIRVQSAPGEGTTFEILLPPARAEAGPRFDSGTYQALQPAPRGGETVLVVEDDAAVRRLVVTVLQGAGYRTLEAEDGETAMALAGGHDGALDLLLVDVVLPDLAGGEVARRIAALRPATRVLFVSGHGQEAIARQSEGGRSGRLLRGSRFLGKPFSPEVLLEKVAKTLARGTPADVARG